jgi:DNA primase
MRFSEAFIQKVIEANDLTLLISKHTQLRESSHNMMGLCPFPDHKERTPSFSVSPQKQVYFCFGCGKKGNIISFLRDYHGMSFPEAIEFLAREAGIPLEVDPSESGGARPEKKSDKQAAIKLYEEALIFYRQQLERALKSSSELGTQVAEYLKARNLSPESLAEFRIGLAPESKNALVDYLRRKGFSMQLAVEMQLVRQDEDGSYRDLFRHRLMFPIWNSVGQPIAFGGRALGDFSPKYLNSPETLLFTKGKTLYAYPITAKFIRTEGYAVLVEGYMDTIGLYQAGIRNVVAPMGTAFTAEQAKLIKRLADKVVVLFDGDSAGISASEKVLPVCLSMGLYPQGVILPDGSDPDDYLKIYGGEALRGLIERAEDLFLLTVKRWVGRENLSLGQKIVLCDQIGPLLKSVQDSRLKNLYFEEIQSLLSVSQKWLKDALKIQEVVQKAQNRISQTRSHGAAVRSEGELLRPIGVEVDRENASDGIIDVSGASKAEAFVLSSMIKNKELWKLGIQIGVPEWISHECCKRLLNKAQDLARQNPGKLDMMASLLISFVKPSDFLFYSDKVLSSQKPSSDAQVRIFMDAAKRMESDFITAKMKTLKQLLHGEISNELVSQLTEMQKRKVSLRQKYQKLQESFSI